MRSILLATCLGAAARSEAAAQLDLRYYLPADARHDASIPTPRSVLGTEIGDWHIRHDQLVHYFEKLAEASPRVTLREYGRTHEQRKLLLATVTSPKNHARIEEIRRDHLAALAGETAPGERPLVVWMGYSVHGNEASGGNAAPLLAYHLAAARGPEVEQLLDQLVILVDPCINPDGFSRFAQWANSHRGRNLVADPQHREHREDWPGGRTNHYWFDLNRDWLLLTHPETRARLEQFHRWKPNVLTDFHEMGSDATYFFQPGVPSRQHPNTPPQNLELTRAIARYHARYLDGLKSLYYTEETFDDFYYGKGSTYPDVNGCIGILFEQASSRGQVQRSSYGDLSFPFTIKNQLTTSLSTLAAARDLRETLLEYQADFYRSAREEAENDPLAGYVFGAPHDRTRGFELLSILRRHQIEVRLLVEDVTLGGETFTAGTSYLAPMAQPQSRLLRALFEQRTEFEDPTFYDVSAWTLPLCFGLPHAEVPRGAIAPGSLGEPLGSPELPKGRLELDPDPYAYVLDWQSYYAPRAAQRLLAAGARVRVATLPFQAETEQGAVDFGHGTLVVPMGIQTADAAEIQSLLRRAAEEDGVHVHAVKSGLTGGGIDLGSPHMLAVEPVRPLLVSGPGTSAYQVGEVWHLLDHRFDVPVSLVDASRLDRVRLDEYTHLLLVSGSYDLEESTVAWIRSWVGRGGVVVATKTGAEWAGRELVRAAPRREDEPGQRDAGEKKEGEQKDEPPDAKKAKEEPPERPAYADYEELRAVDLVAGAIFETELDLTHPICFGLARPTLSVFRDSTSILERDENPFANPVVYAREPLRSGYCSAKNLEKIAGSAAVAAHKLGEGTVIQFIDNPNFRGVWYGTNRLYLNSLFFGKIIKRTRNLWEEERAMEEPPR